MIRTSSLQKRCPAPSFLRFSQRKKKLVKPKTPSFLMCSHNYLLFPSILKTVWILPFVCRAVLYLLYWCLTYLFKCIFYYFVDDCSVGSVLFDVALMFTLFDPSTLWTFIKFASLVGSVHSVECGRDPWWPSTLWTCIILWTGWVRQLCVLGSWTLVGSVHFVVWS